MHAVLCVTRVSPSAVVCVDDTERPITLPLHGQVEHSTFNGWKKDSLDEAGLVHYLL